MKILLTGGTGYIGSHTAVALLEAGHDVTLLDNFSNSKPAVLDRLHTITGVAMDFFETDVTDEAALTEIMKQRSFDAAIHFAAPKAVGESMEKPLHYFKNGVGGTVALLQTMADHGVRNVVYSSSATVYGFSDDLPLVEGAPTVVINPYGRTKLMCEEILQDLCRADERWNAIALRYFNPVGAHPSGLIGEDPQGVPANLMPFVAQVAVGRRPELTIFGDDYPTPDGTGVRDYLHVMDLAEGHVAAVEHLASDPGYDVINLGTGSGISVKEIVAAFEKASGMPIPTVIAGRRPGDGPASYADANKAASVLGWRATRSLDEMCADVWRWQSQNPNGYGD
ncbi:MAG: UDP-glucose 4-epimerase GalE [Acidimicrobiia bacterium]|nr:UDP-glucose 4-epimerase GalE [Acidimicrobiia bacterium]